MSAVYTEEYKGYTIAIHPDEFAGDPRKEWDNLAKIVSVDDRVASDSDAESPIDSPDGWSLPSSLKCAVCLPLYLYDHSGYFLSVSRRNYPFNDLWDVSRIGWMYITRQDALKEFGYKRITAARRAQLERRIESEIRIQNDYLTENVWSFVITDEDGDFVDSGGGYFGDIHADYSALSEAKAVIDFEIAHRPVDLGIGL